MPQTEMAYLEGHGYSGGDHFEFDRGEPDGDFSRFATLAVVCCTIVVLAASVLLGSDNDRSPWTAGSGALITTLLAILAAAGLTYRAVRRHDGTTADAIIASVTVMLATPIASAGGYVVLSILGVT